MTFMFRDASAFNQDLRKWKVSKVTMMASMFRDATSFNQNISGWDVRKVTTMSHMFSGATAFNQDIGDWVVDNVINMNLMFRNATSFDQNIGRWDVSNVRFMISMFAGATLSTENYDALLTRWSMLDLQLNVNFHAGNSEYCNQAARNVLTETYGWTIADSDSLADDCPLTFGVASIPDQIYNIGRTVNVILPYAYGGTGDLNYALELIPAGLDFTTATRTLAGTPNTAMTTVTLTYRVTDSADSPTTAELTFMVTVNKGEQIDFIWGTDATVNKITEANPFIVTPTSGSGTGAVTYESSDTAVATVDIDSGEVIIKTIGTTTITATKAADANYNAATASYTLTVTIAALPLTFGTASIDDQISTVDQTFSVTLPLAPADAGTGNLSYTLTPKANIPAGLTFTTTTDTPMLTGTPKAAMTAVTLTYTVTDNSKPTSATAKLSFTITVNKGEQIDFIFTDATVNKITEANPFIVTPTGGSSTGAVTYESSDTAVATVDINSGEVIIKTTGTTTITATKAPDANYNAATASYTLTVTVTTPPLTFDTSIIPAPNSAYTYNVSRTVSITLPPTTGGTGDLTYTLDGPIPAGLRFDDDARTLTGIPSTTAASVTLTYRVADSADTPIIAELTFTVTVLSGAFITTWQISPGSVANRTITIPIHADSSYEYTVDWGDNSDNTEIYTNTIPATHTYLNAGNYKVAITGEFPRIYFNNSGDTDKIISIDQWGNNRWDSMARAFRGCSKLSNYTAIDTPDLSQVTDMSLMFSGASVFNGNIGDWEVDNVTNMQSVLSSAADSIKTSAIGKSTTSPVWTKCFPMHPRSIRILAVGKSTTSPVWAKCFPVHPRSIRISASGKSATLPIWAPCFTRQARSIKTSAVGMSERLPV